MKIFFAVSLILAFGSATAANAQSCRIGSGPDLGDGFPYCSEFPPVVSVGGGYGYARQALRDAGWQPLPTADCASNMGVDFEKLCQRLPETESCSGNGYCLFHFALEPGWALTITTYGDYDRALDRGGNTGIRIESLDLTLSQANDTAASSIGTQMSRKYSQSDYVEMSTAVIAAQGICDFEVKEDTVKAYVAEKVPDVPWSLFDARVRGYQRILSGLPEEKKALTCSETRDLAASAGWIK